MTYKMNGKLFGFGSILLLSISIFSNLLIGSTAHAYCPPPANWFQDNAVELDNDHHSQSDIQKILETNPNAKCATDMINEFNSDPNSGGRTISEASLAQGISTCRDGKSAGNFNNNQFNNCANAYVTCMRKAIQTSDCNVADVLSTVASETGCNNGRTTDNDSCRIDEVNANHFTEAINADKKTADSACLATAKAAQNPNQPDLSAQNTQYNNCTNAMNAAIDKCGSVSQGGSSSYSSSAMYTRGSNATTGTKQLADYNNCMQQAMNTQANNDATLCKNVNGGNGFYVDNAIPDPTGGSSNVQKGCYSNYSDLINADACQQKGGTWSQEPGKTGNDGWGCHPPAGVNNDGTTGNKDKTTQTDTPPAAQKYGQCGNAQTVLVGCSTCSSTKGVSNGIQIIGCMLKYAITALTAVIGVAAVAGIVYEAVQYARAQDNQSIVSDARQRILNIVIGLIVYIFMIVLIGWLVPGAAIGG